MPTEGPAQCLSQRISCRLLLARVSLQQSLPSQHVAPANRPSSGSSSGNPAEASRLFRWKSCVEMSLVSWKQLLHLHLIFLYVALNFRSFGPSQPWKRSRTKTHPIHLPPRKADLHPLSHQPHRAQDADQAKEKVAATTPPPSLCHPGPSTRCFSTAPRSPWNS